MRLQTKDVADCQGCEASHILDLKRANEKLEEFTHIASHDLRSPLRAILSLVEWVQDDLARTYGELPENIAADLGEISAQGRRMSKLLTDLLEFSRVGSAAMTIEAFDAFELINECVQITSVPASFVVQIAESMPQIECSPAEFAIVMRNLVANCVKHHDRPAGSIKIDGWEDMDLGYFRVRDDGPGIESKDADRIFTMFQSLNSSGGNGIGLGMVKKIVDQYGGSVRAEANPEGRGSAFIVAFPLNTEGHGMARTAVSSGL